MWTSVACSCVRNGRKISASVATLSFKTQTSAWGQGYLHLSARLLPPGPKQLLSPLLTSSRSVSLSACACGDSALQDSLGNFGSLSADISSRRSFKKTSPDLRDLPHHEADPWEKEEKEETARRRPGRGRNTPYFYFLQCKKLIREHKLQEALDVFSKDMLQGERLQPEESNYSILIGGCGRAGQLKKAFRLYNDMKKRGLVPSDATYTALFNACAESPHKQGGLQQALKLEQELRRKKHPLSTITYHALLKTHAFTNHLQACVHTLREMLQNGHVVTQVTFHYLLMGCLKDKEAGFRLALQVWRQMLLSDILPDSHNYNLLLRTARDCGIGNPALASSVLLRADGDRLRHRNKASASKSVLDIDLLERQLFLQAEPPRESWQESEDIDEKFNVGQEPTYLVPVSQTGNVPPPVHAAAESAAPSLLDVFEGKGGALVSLGTVNGAADRLALIGGGDGVLEKMAANGLIPDLRTLTLLADMMEPGNQSLQGLLRAAKQHRVKLDVGFFNSAIRRAAKAKDAEGAKAVLVVMRQRNVSVDVRTFGCLALACEKQNDGLQLLEDMEEVGLRPNVQVFSALIGGAVRRLDYVYLKTLLQTMRNMEVWPNEVVIRQLEFAAQYPPNYNQYKHRNNYLVHIDGFRGYYQQWLKQMPAQDAEQEEEQEEVQRSKGDALQVEDGLTEAHRNQRAAARRFHSRNPDKRSSTASTPQLHS